MFNDEAEQIDNIAAQWSAKCLSGKMTTAEQRALDYWLGLKSAHQDAFDAYMAVADMASEASDAVSARGLENELYEELARETKRTRRWVVAAPAMAASFAIASLISINIFSNNIEPVIYATHKGERAEFTLADGSVASLNTNSEISVTLDENERYVALTRGEVLFDVVRDIDRPFVVDSLNAKVMVLGTRFSVRADASDVVVSVLSGVVSVGENSPGAEPGANEVTLIAGQQAALAAQGGEITVDRFNPDAAVSWQRGRALYENDTLEDVVDDLNRYFPARLVIAEEALKDIRVTGAFDLNDQAVAVEALSVALSLRSEHRGSDQILLYAND